MRLSERRCEACGEPADGEPSAHFARVVWLCKEHSEEFHAPEMQAVLRHPEASTKNIWAAIDLWLRTTITLRLVGGRLRLVPVTFRGNMDCAECGGVVHGEATGREICSCTDLAECAP